MKANLKWVGMVVKDLDRTKAIYAELFGAKYIEEPSPYAGPRAIKTNPFGGNPPHLVSGDMDVGLELIQPLPGRDSEYAQFLEKRGEGLFGMDFVTDDIEEVKRRAERLGITFLRHMEFDQEEIERFNMERVFGVKGLKRIRMSIMRPSPETCGVRILVVQLDPK